MFLSDFDVLKPVPYILI